MDPLLLKLFAYLVPKTEFTELCENVPPYLSVEILIRRALLPIHPNVSHITNRERQYVNQVVVFFRKRYGLGILKR
jgi:hypothetical protein